jgi:RNA polymerase sigma-70 factor (ECF subfamily)
MNPTSTTEERLVMALREHRSAGFSLLYDAYAPALYRVVLQLVKDPVWAQDLLQDTFVKIWLNNQCYDPGQGRLFTWIVTIARNVALDALRTQKVRRAKSQTIGEASEKITHPRLGEGMVHQSLLSQLAPKHRDIVELLYYRGYTGQEVATTLNLPLGTVKTRARLALQQLKVFFSQDIHHYQAG